MAQSGGPSYHPYLRSALPALCRLISDPESRIESNVVATENMVSALSKLFQFGGDEFWNSSDCLPKGEVIRVWYEKGLPITTDESEGVQVYGYFLELVKR